MSGGIPTDPGGGAMLIRVDGQRVVLRVALSDVTGDHDAIPLGSVEPGGVYLRLGGDDLPVRVVEDAAPEIQFIPTEGEEALRLAFESARMWTTLVATGPAPEDASVDDGSSERIVLESGQALRSGETPVLFRVVSGYVRLNAGRRDVMPQYMLLNEDLWCRAEGHAELERVQPSSDGAVECLRQAILALGGSVQDSIRRLMTDSSGKIARQIAAVRGSEKTGIGNALRLMSTILVGKKADIVMDIPGEPDHFTAVRIVAEASGIDVPDLSDLWPKSENLDTTVRMVSDRIGFAIRQVELGDRWTSLDGGPILTTRRDDGAPLALVPEGGRRYRATVSKDGIQTPLGRVGSGQAKMVDSEGWMFYRPLPLRPMGLGDVIRFAVRGTGWDLGLMFLVSLLTALVSLAIPIATGLLVGKVIPSGSDAGVFGVVLALVVAAVASSIFGIAIGIARIRFETRASMHVMAGAVLRTILLPAKFFDRYTAGDLTQRLMSIEHLRQTISSAVITSLLHSIVVVVYLGLIFYYSWKMAIVAFALVLVVIVYMAAFSIIQIKFVRIVQETTGQLEGLTNQMIKGIRVIRANRAEARLYTRWVDTFAKQRLAGFRDRSISNILQVLHVVISLVATGACLWLVGKGYAGIDTAGEYMSFSSAFGALMGSLFGFSVVLLPLVRLVPIYDRLRPIFQETPENAGGTPPGRLSGRIDCRGLTFSYEEGGRKIIDGLDLTIESGEYVAIVGDSGCGKSTLVKLLLGFERPTAGEISYDNRALHSLDRRAVRMQVGTAIQDGSLLPGDIRMNILGAAPLPIEEAWKVARTVGLASRIQAMPMGMFTFVTDQIVSPVFRQQMLLAKALVGNPAMLIVDEVTSQLDVAVQKEIQAKIDDLGITRIVIAHRLSTIRNADTIHVLDRGRIVQSGDFETLAAEEGPFRTKLEKGQL